MVKNDKAPAKVEKTNEPEIKQVRKLTILEVGLFKGSNYFLQKFGNEFQYIIFRNGQFFQSYISVNPRQGEDFNQQELIEVTRVIKNFMETTTEALIQKELMAKDKNYKTPIEKANEKAEEEIKQEEEKKKKEKKPNKLLN